MLPINIWTYSASLKLNLKKLRSWDPAPSFMANRRRKVGSSDRFLHVSLLNHCGCFLQPWNQRMFASWQESYEKHKQCVEKQKHHSAQQTGRWLSFSFGFLNFLSSPHWSLKSLSFLVLQDSKIILSISLPSPEISHLFKNPCIIWWETYLEATW